MRQVNGIPVPNSFIALEGPSAEDLAKYGFDADESSSSRWNGIVTSVSRSRVLKVAAAFGALLLGGNHLLENSHSAEASVTGGPLFNDDVIGGSLGIALAGLNEAPDYTILYADPDSNGRKDIVNYLLIPYKGATPDMLQKVGQDILTGPRLFYLPSADDKELKEYQSRIRILTVQPQKDLNCTGLLDCLSGSADEDGKMIWSETKRMRDTMGVTPHETLAVIKMKDGQDPAWIGTGIAHGANSYASPPSLYSFASILRSPYAWDNGGWLSAKNTNHERGHSEYGFDHPNYPSIMSHTHPGKTFSTGESEFIRADNKLLPYAYVPRNHDDPNDKTPRHEIIVNGVSSTANQVVQNSNMRMDLSIKYPDGATQMHIKGTSANNDGPGVNMIINPANNFKVEAPQIGVGNYTVLPGSTMTWSMCTAGVKYAIAEGDPNWKQFQGWPGNFFDNECANMVIKMPDKDGKDIVAISPPSGQTVSTTRPRIQWYNPDPTVFYYEVQLSKDSTFNNDSTTATAPVFWNLIHGGITTPLNSWEVPAGADLEPYTQHYWRIRPRQQGDATSGEWSRTFTFGTPAEPGGIKEAPKS